MTNELTAVEKVKQEPQSLAVVENTSIYVGQPIDRSMVTEFADTLMGVHPGAKDVGVVGMRTVAQLALITGANPLPGTNGIHAWKDNKGRICVQFGVGFWRSQAELEGGVLWTERPRPMSPEEREYYGIEETQAASICIGALGKHVFNLIRDAHNLGITVSLKDAKDEVARIGTGVVDAREYTKAGRSRQWSADLRAERDMLRQLVPVMARAQKNLQEGTISSGGEGWSAGEFVRIQTENTKVPDGYTVEDANSDFFDDDPSPTATREEVEAEADFLEGVIVEEGLDVDFPDDNKEKPAEIKESEEATEEAAKKDDRPVEKVTKQENRKGELTDDELHIFETPYSQFWITLLALIDRYDNVPNAQNAAKKLGFTSTPGKNTKEARIARVKMYRKIRDHAAARDLEEAEQAELPL